MVMLTRCVNYMNGHFTRGAQLFDKLAFAALHEHAFAVANACAPKLHLTCPWTPSATRHLNSRESGHTSVGNGAISFIKNDCACERCV
jgi:hypothetical protein